MQQHGDPRETRSWIAVADLISARACLDAPARLAGGRTSSPHHERDHATRGQHMVSRADPRADLKKRPGREAFLGHLTPRGLLFTREHMNPDADPEGGTPARNEPLRAEPLLEPESSGFGTPLPSRSLRQSRSSPASVTPGRSPVAQAHRRGAVAVPERAGMFLEGS